MKESALWASIKANLDGPDVHMSRVESTVGSGMSDVAACCGGQERWLELKMFHGSRLHFRNSQRIWMGKRTAVGGRVLVVARRDDDLMIWRAQDVLTAPHTSYPERKSFSVSANDLPTPLYTCHKPFKWFEIRTAIFSPT